MACIGCSMVVGIERIGCSKVVGTDSCGIGMFDSVVSWGEFECSDSGGRVSLLVCGIGP